MATILLTNPVRGLEPSKTEVKIVLDPNVIPAALQAFKLKKAKALHRKIYFLDSPDLWLLQQGIILRARSAEKNNIEITVKFRSQKLSAFPKRWLDHSKVELEKDDVGLKQPTYALTLKKMVSKKVFKEVRSDSKKIESLFSRHQRQALKEFVKKDLRLLNLQFFGPIQSYLWQSPSPRADIELWKIMSKGNFEIFELSTKVANEEASLCRKSLIRLVKKQSLSPLRGVFKTSEALRFLTRES